MIPRWARDDPRMPPRLTPRWSRDGPKDDPKMVPRIAPKMVPGWHQDVPQDDPKIVLGWPQRWPQIDSTYGPPRHRGNRRPLIGSAYGSRARLHFEPFPHKYLGFLAARSGDAKTAKKDATPPQKSIDFDPI